MKRLSLVLLLLGLAFPKVGHTQLINPAAAITPTHVKWYGNGTMGYTLSLYAKTPDVSFCSANTLDPASFMLPRFDQLGDDQEEICLEVTPFIDVSQPEWNHSNGRLSDRFYLCMDQKSFQTDLSIPKEGGEAIPTTMKRSEKEKSDKMYKASEDAYHRPFFRVPLNRRTLPLGPIHFKLMAFTKSGDNRMETPLGGNKSSHPDMYQVVGFTLTVVQYPCTDVSLSSIYWVESLLSGQLGGPLNMEPGIVYHLGDLAKPPTYVLEKLAHPILESALAEYIQSQSAANHGSTDGTKSASIPQAVPGTSNMEPPAIIDPYDSGTKTKTTNHIPVVFSSPEPGILRLTPQEDIHFKVDMSEDLQGTGTSINNTGKTVIERDVKTGRYQEIIPEKFPHIKVWVNGQEISSAQLRNFLKNARKK